MADFNQRRGQSNFDEDSPYSEKVINIDRVARVVKGGRRFRFKALVVVGDGKSQVGVGVSKGADVQAAVKKAVDVAKKNLFTIPKYKDTIPHDVQAKVSGAVILIKPASSGTGIIAGGVVRSILEMGGIHNVLSKSIGSSNKVNAAYATIEALKQLKTADQWVTRQNKPAVNKQTAKAKAAVKEAV